VIQASNPLRPIRMSRPGDAYGLAVLLVAAVLAAGTLLPLSGARGPAFPQPPVAEVGARPGADAGTPKDARTADGHGWARVATPKPHLHTPLDINAAGAETLQALPGIGPALAERILADREARGPFRAPEDLLRVPGIGPKRWERIRPLVRLEER